MLKNRYAAAAIVADLPKKMVFVSGPRQIGKTTLARDLVAAHFRGAAYFNWDNRHDRKRLNAGEWPSDVELVILDEIHKSKGWKRFVKGEYDAAHGERHFLITGSSRLDVYRRGGDSLQGRYHHYRLHPFSLAELTGRQSSPQSSAQQYTAPFQPLRFEAAAFAAELAALLRFGGFPEPLLAQNDKLLRRWHNERSERLFREDVRDGEIIHDLGKMQMLSDMLPVRVGSLLSTNAIREDLEVGHRTAARWLDILESFFYHFRIYPYARDSVRALRKAPKLYLWDWSEVLDEAARFENCVASALHKFVHWLKDRDGYKVQLHFVRDTAKREVDFLVAADGKPWFAVEVKTQDEKVASDLRYFGDRFRIPFLYQVVKKSGVDKTIDGVRVISADKFLAALI